jgi:hypothetical protein
MIRRGENHRSAIVCLGVLATLVLVVCLVFVGSAAAVPSEQPFEIESGSFHVTTSTVQAGAHEDLTVAFDFTHNSQDQTFNDVRDTIVNLPAGFTGNNTAVPTCTFAVLLTPQSCPPETQVGTITLDLTFATKLPVRMTFPVYNMAAQSPGIVAELGFAALGVTQVLPITVRPGDSGLTVTAPDIVTLAEPHDVSVTTWGIPASHAHDAERGQTCAAAGGNETVECKGGGKSVNLPLRPFLSNPTSCGPFTASMQADSWQEQGHFVEAQTQVGPIGECERVPFHPSIEVGPTTDSAESSSGLNISLVVPQNWAFPESISTSNLKDTTVALPVGYTANPSLASGLGTCTPQQLEAETFSSPPGSGCPPEAKIGAVEVETPVLDEKLGGNIYIATPFDNKFGSLLALYIVVKDPLRGIVVKLQGQIEPNPVTGQLVTRFDNSPQVPFGKFTLKLRQGASSPLVSPPACGTYTTEADLTPWSAPLEAHHLLSSFQIEHGIGGGPCPTGGVPPFKPGILAGTLNNSAGAYSPMDIRITRGDGEQEIMRFTSILPPGLTANLSGIPFCPDADIEAAKHVSGAQEEAEPSCPAASEIGHSLVGAGVGTVLAYTPGKVYLAGPYHGAPFSIAAITSAKVGPFDLGTVVVREALVINPETGVVTVDAKASDPIPHIIDGIVIHVRDIRVYIDRPSFMINPTSCDPMSFAATVGGGGADPANPADQQFVTVNSSFQMANCQNLQFKPSFKVSTAGKTSRANGASLHVTLTYPKALQGTQANIHSVKVDLPKQLPSRLTTLQKACVDSIFDANPAACPAASHVGSAKAITPILPVPIEGPAYFVSHGGAKFPELIVVLQGYGVTIDLHGETFINKEGVTSSTFRSVPDEPVTSFELTLPQGPDSALAANGDLCSLTRTVLAKRKVTVRVKDRRKTVTRSVRKTVAGSFVMPTAFTAQNGMVIKQNTPIGVTGCPKKKAVKKAKTNH